MENFLRVLSQVLCISFLVSLVIGAVFTAIATPKKNLPLEKKHKSAKKISNIILLSGSGCLILGVLGLALSSNLPSKPQISKNESSVNHISEDQPDSQTIESKTSLASQITNEDSADSSEHTDLPLKVNKVSELLFNGELVLDVATRDLVNNYDYILDIAYVVDEDNFKINIAVQVPSGTNAETVKKAGDKAARYLATLANFANSEFELPGAEDLGGLFEKYNLLLYIDDGYGGIDKYGAKVTMSPVITW